ncbi:VWA domain-containing protein [Paenibacillus sp. SYP-B3998]|uniref:VWA domain-containing protein n=1 Tax=Paenibacillus sp. SYP-B3998 TaxID=2678564 RepID=A0A6G4A461_9BACL|nr:VWA domain-containing protein [Paenibacillus sp. SYP-B3998]NEW09175.1 VWA domain-containing protein [Paenibacillus sp. SYP-B3998]
MLAKPRNILTFIMLLLISFVTLLTACNGSQDANMSSDNNQTKNSGKPVLRILSSSENKDFDPQNPNGNGIIADFMKTQDFDVQFVLKGSVDSMSELTNNTGAYDAVWLANSQWILMGDKNKKVKDQKSIMTSPVVWGIKKSVAEQLGFIGKEVTVQQLSDAVQNKKLKFAMTSASQSNSGASAYMGFLYALLNNPQTITMEDLHRSDLAPKMRSLLSGVNRGSGSSEWLKDLFLKSNYDAMVNYESVLITTNNNLVASGKEPLYLIYPVNGMTVADYSLGYINNSKDEQETRFKALQDYLMLSDVQKKILSTGRRTGMGGIVTGADPSVFNKNWGIDTTRLLSPIVFPEPEVTLEALNLYQTTFKKPSFTVFCIDYSGSMSGNGGEKGVKSAMDLLLTQAKAKESLLQSSSEDVVVVLPFNSNIIAKWTAVGPQQFPDLLKRVKELAADGGTNIYLPAIEALNILKDVDQEKYVTSVVLMTDGISNGSLKDFTNMYNKIQKDIPVFSITFGDADESQLKSISDLTRADVFPSGGDLVASFKKVRGYN